MWSDARAQIALVVAAIALTAPGCVDTRWGVAPIEVRVVDRATGAPLPGARLESSDGDIVELADADPPESLLLPARRIFYSQPKAAIT